MRKHHQHKNLKTESKPQNPRNKPGMAKKGGNRIGIFPFSGSFSGVNSKCAEAQTYKKIIK